MARFDGSDPMALATERGRHPVLMPTRRSCSPPRAESDLARSGTGPHDLSWLSRPSFRRVHGSVSVSNAVGNHAPSSVILGSLEEGGPHATSAHRADCGRGSGH